MKKPLWMFLVLFGLSVAACAAAPKFAKELVFEDFFAKKPGWPTEYTVIGNGWIRGVQADGVGEFIATWIKKHPRATLVPVAQWQFPIAKRKENIVYIWIVDGEASLNVD